MPDDFEIVPYDPRDLDAIAALWLRSWASAVPRLADATPLDALTDRFAREAVELWQVLVARKDGIPVGFAAFIEDEGKLDQLFVDPLLHSTGIGSTLMDLLKAAMPRGIWLSTATENVSACRFYERRGFVLEGHGTHPSLGHQIVFYRWSGAEH